MQPDEVAELVRRAAAGDQEAWTRLTRTYNPLLWTVAMSYRLRREEAADLVQATWLRLVDGIGGLRHPELVAAWLTTTMRRLCLQRLRDERRERPTAADWVEIPDPADPPETRVMRAARATTVRTAVRALPERQQRLVWYMATEPGASYRDISVTLGIPVGAIGPTRARALDRLRDLLREDRRAGVLAD
jgi:RNA polymerase sigma factor (sigma-70 family)